LHLGAIFALAVILAAPAAAAAETDAGVETVELIYHVPKGCPDQDAFVSAVTARTQRATFGKAGADARRFVVDVRRVEARYAGRLIIEHQGARATREVTSARCEDLVKAFVFFTAIAIDLNTSVASGEPGPSSAPASPPAAEPPSPPSPSHPGSPPPAPLRESTAPKPTPRVVPAWHLSVGSGGYVASGVADSAMVAALPVVELASSAMGLSPSVRLGLAWANGASQQELTGKLSLGLRAVVLSGCGYHLRFGGESGPAVRFCALLEGGVLAVRTFAVERPNSPDRPWFAFGPLLRLEIPILPARLAIGGDAAIAIPVEREHVYVRSGPTVELVDQVGLRVGATLLVRLF
jgi:hypothetical protein